MIKKHLSLLLAGTVLTGVLSACGQKAAAPAPESTAASVSSTESTAVSTTSPESTAAPAPESTAAPAAASDGSGSDDSGSGDALSGATSPGVLEPGADADMVTSASVVPETIMEDYTPKGFTDGNAKKALFVVADPRYATVTRVLANTAMSHFEDKGVEVEVRDLYAMGFDPVLSAEDFYYAKDGIGEPSDAVKTEQEYVTKADYLIFVYPNWHDTPTAMAKGYMEKVFAKKFAYQDLPGGGLEGLLSGKGMYTIMNCGYLGGGRGWIGDGVGIEDEKWDRYMEAFKVFDDDTAAFWGVENLGRFVNDRTPSNGSKEYVQELEELKESLEEHLDQVFFS
ncbi:MAG: flavodoxin family protein [Hungatella sp.]|nr:flavodoxin family protein [Hungatella sp.]